MTITTGLFSELRRRNVFRVAASYAVVAWLLVQAADILLGNFGAPDWVFRSFVSLLLLGFPLALFLSWAYELTPEGVKKTRDVPPAESSTRMSGRTLDFVVIAALVVGLGYFVVDKFVLSPPKQAGHLASAVEQARESDLAESAAELAEQPSIAVLAFRDMSPNRDQDYLSDGIAEELLNLLSRIPELRVTSRTSAFSYKGKDIRLAQLAEELNVAHILDGSVRLAGERVRITAQLIDARSDTHLWSESYDRTLDDIFAIQDEIAQAVVEQLRITLLGDIPQTRQTHPEAYALYLQARHTGRRVTAEGLAQSNALFEQALAIDPAYVDAWYGLSANAFNQVISGLVPPHQGYARAGEVLLQALAIDPDHARSHAGLAWIARNSERRLDRAANHLRRAIALNPTDEYVINGAAGLLHDLGRVNESIALHEYLAVRDPVSPIAHYNLGFRLLTGGYWDQAISAYQTALRLSPELRIARSGIGTALLMLGEPEAALEYFQQEPFARNRVRGLALALHDLGRVEESRAALAEVIKRWGDEWPSSVALVYAHMGDADRSFEWLDRAVAQNQIALSTEFLMPFYRPVHDDPRWRRFLEQVGSTPEQLAAVEFEFSPPAAGRR